MTITQNTQPCLYCTDLAAAVALRESGISANMTAGFSLGEIAALALRRYVEIKEGFRLVCRRGELMQKAAAKHDSAMVAVVKLSNETVEMLLHGISTCISGEL